MSVTLHPGLLEKMGFRLDDSIDEVPVYVYVAEITEELLEYGLDDYIDAAANAFVAEQTAGLKLVVQVRPTKSEVYWFVMHDNFANLPIERVYTLPQENRRFLVFMEHVAEDYEAVHGVHVDLYGEEVAGQIVTD